MPCFELSLIKINIVWNITKMKFMLKTDLINKLVYYHKHIKILQKYYVFHKGKKILEKSWRVKIQVLLIVYDRIEIEQSFEMYVDN